MALKSKNGKVAGQQTTEDADAEDDEETSAEGGDGSEGEEEEVSEETESPDESEEDTEEEAEDGKPAFKPITSQAELQARINKAIQKRLARERKRAAEKPAPAPKPKQTAKEAGGADSETAELLALLRDEKISEAKQAIKKLPKNLQALVPWEVDSLASARKVLTWVAKAAPAEAEGEPARGNQAGPKGQVRKTQPKLTAEELAERARKSRLYRW